MCNFRPVPQADPAEWKLPLQGQCVSPLHCHPGPALTVLCLQVGDNKVQYSTVHYSTVQNITVQYSMSLPYTITQDLPSPYYVYK